MFNNIEKPCIPSLLTGLVKPETEILTHFRQI